MAESLLTLVAAASALTQSCQVEYGYSYDFSHQKTFLLPYFPLQPTTPFYSCFNYHHNAGALLSKAHRATLSQINTTANFEDKFSTKVFYLGLIFRCMSILTTYDHVG